LPKQFARPLQVVHFVPANNVAIGLQSLPASMEDYLGPCVRAGRAVFGVVLRGYQERRPNPESSAEPAPTTAEYRDKIVNWITDLRRGLDYLETRRDVDVGRLGFFAPSAGSRVGLILTAVENRYRSVFLTGSGVRKAYGTWITGTNPIDFAAHIKGPTFMFQGRYDESMGLKTEAEPLFKLLPEPKRLVVFEGGHIAPFELLVTTMNAWLDETLGPVKRQ
jgi:pimeloyl-ACP methyl ester carboxylesterase